MTELTTQNTALAIPEENSAWGAEGVSTKDMIISRLQLMHDISENVKRGKSRPGDIVNSSTGEVLAPAGQALEIIPINTFREWHKFEVQGKKEVFISKIPCTKANENLPLETIENGKPIINRYVLNFSVLLASRITELPYLVSFKKSGMFAGKILATYFQTCLMTKQPPAKKIYKLSSVDKTYDGFTYKAFAIEAGRASTTEEVQAARLWYEMITMGVTQIAEDEAEMAPF